LLKRLKERIDIRSLICRFGGIHQNTNMTQRLLLLCIGPRMQRRQTSQPGNKFPPFHVSAPRLKLPDRNA
jgi:hypothetical protein